MKKIVLIIFMFVLMGAAVSFAGWDPDAPQKPGTAKELNVEDTIDKFKAKDSDLKKFFDKAYGYAVFPTVGKGAIGIGGAYGKGVVYERGKPIGSVSLSQLSWGFQLGGQAYSEIIFFKDKAALNTFTDGNFEFGAGLSAVALTAGASADTDYSKGVAVFTMAKGGLMYEASISGQKFSYTPYLD
jgi:lipid-binding SYLF domain-containing protein